MTLGIMIIVAGHVDHGKAHCYAGANKSDIPRIAGGEKAWHDH